MSSWFIPSKTFLVGEYIALSGGPAILLTTTPCFEIRPVAEKKLVNIHPDSPAGRLWSAGPYEYGLSFYDPYEGLGGMGASTAQFIGVYSVLKKSAPSQLDIPSLLQAYERYAWNGVGQKPSGYDLLAQRASECVLVNRKQGEFSTSSWPFSDLSFLLVHTHQKLATHQHLTQLSLPADMSCLLQLSQDACQAFKNTDESAFIQAIKMYGSGLKDLNLVADHSNELVYMWSQWSEVLAIKGCGAMGADVILLITEQKHLNTLVEKVTTEHHSVIATSNDLFLSAPLLSQENMGSKT